MVIGSGRGRAPLVRLVSPAPFRYSRILKQDRKLALHPCHVIPCILEHRQCERNFEGSGPADSAPRARPTVPVRQLRLLNMASRKEDVEDHRTAAQARLRCSGRLLTPVTSSTSCTRLVDSSSAR